MKDREKAIFVAAAILFGFTIVSPEKAGHINTLSIWDGVADINWPGETRVLYR